MATLYRPRSVTTPLLLPGVEPGRSWNFSDREAEVLSLMCPRLVSSTLGRKAPSEVPPRGNPRFAKGVGISPSGRPKSWCFRGPQVMYMTKMGDKDRLGWKEPPKHRHNLASILCCHRSSRSDLSVSCEKPESCIFM